VTTAYELRCRACGKAFEPQPLSICDACSSPLEVVFDLEYARSRFTREAILRGPLNLWRYRALLPVGESCAPRIPAGLTPLMKAPRLGAHIGAHNLYLKNDAVCMPTLSFKDRVAAVALANAKAFGFETVGCSSTGDLANAVAAQAARLGLKAFLLVPSDLEPAKILSAEVYGAAVVRVEGSYEHIERLGAQIAERYKWGFANANLRCFGAEGAKTVGFEIAEQLGWRLPDNIVVPMAGGALISSIRKAFDELIALGIVEDRKVRFFGAQATGCSPISAAVKKGTDAIEPQRPNTMARSLAIGTPADGAHAARVIRLTDGWAEDVSDVEIVSAIQELAETEGVFTGTAGAVATAVTARLYAHGRIQPDELTVACITGNGLQTAEVLTGAYDRHQAIRPQLSDFENLVGQHSAESQGFSLAGENHFR